MYIRRKVFSVAVDEMGEEKYFSINEVINEEDYLNEVMYSDNKKNNRNNNEPRKLSKEERKLLADYLKAGKRERKDNELTYRGDIETDKKEKRKLRNKSALRDAKHEGLKGAASGAALGTAIAAGGRLVGVKFNPKETAQLVGGGAALLGGTMGLAGGVGSRAGYALRDKLSRKNETYRKAIEQGGDLYKVSEGKMNVNTYKKKYNNTDSDNKKQKK